MAFSSGFVFLCVMVIAAYATILQPGTYLDCGSTGTMNELDVLPCPTGLPCSLQRRTNSSVAINFTLREPAEKLEVFVYGVIGPVEIQFGGIHQDACLEILDEATNATACPIKDITKSLVFRSNVEVLSVYPLFPLGIKFKIVNPAKPDESVACLQFDAQITAEAA